MAELVKENKLLDVQWMAAEARAAAAEARDAGVNRGERSAPDAGYSNAASEPVSKSMVEARLLTMLVSQIFTTRFANRCRESVRFDGTKIADFRPSRSLGVHFSRD